MNFYTGRSIFGLCICGLWPEAVACTRAGAVGARAPAPLRSDAKVPISTEGDPNPHPSP